MQDYKGRYRTIQDNTWLYRTIQDCTGLYRTNQDYIQEYRWLNSLLDRLTKIGDRHIHSQAHIQTHRIFGILRGLLTKKYIFTSFWVNSFTGKVFCRVKSFPGYVPSRLCLFQVVGLLGYVFPGCVLLGYGYFGLCPSTHICMNSFSNLTFSLFLKMIWFFLKLAG